MGRPFESELNELEATYLETSNRWNACEIASDQSHITNSQYPLIVVGSGGSLSAAQLWANLHSLTGQGPALALTPMQLQERQSLISLSHVAVISAGGSNRDILQAARIAIAQRAPRITALTVKKQSRLTKLLDQYDKSRTLLGSVVKSDGFLSVNSLLSFFIILLKSYSNLNQSLSLNQKSWDEIIEGLDSSAKMAADLSLKNNLVMVLFDSLTAAAAHDLESKSIEAGLIPVNICEIKNFCHGRHNWFDKQPTQTHLMSVASENTSRLSQRLLKSIPDNITKTTITFGGNTGETIIQSLIFVFFYINEIGKARKIDPGRPGVPKWGSKIYGEKLPPPPGLRGAEPARRQIIEHKARRCQIDLPSLNKSFDRFITGISLQKFHALIVDYDGTLVSTSRRSEPPTEDIFMVLNRLASNGVPILISTGRGRSAFDSMREGISRRNWSTVYLSMYGGALNICLKFRRPGKQEAGKGHAGLREAWLLLSSAAVESYGATLEWGQDQISVQVSDSCSDKVGWLYNFVSEILCSKREHIDWRISGHSIDIFPVSKSKSSSIKWFFDAANLKTEANLLAIGDRPCWPGNDADLMNGAVGLSVDEGSATPSNGWNLMPELTNGPDIFLSYLQNAVLKNDFFSLELPWDSYETCSS